MRKLHKELLKVHIREAEASIIGIELENELKKLLIEYKIRDNQIEKDLYASFLVFKESFKEEFRENFIKDNDKKKEIVS